MDRMAEAFVRHAQRNGFGDQPGAQRGAFQLLRADAVARALDHGVTPPDEI